MSDAAAESRLANDVWCEAFDLVQQTLRLGRAIMRARMGHRGWSISRGFIAREVNRALHRTGFRLVDDDPDKSWESYEDAYFVPDNSRQHERLRVLAEVAEMLQQMENTEHCQPYAARLTGSAALREAREEIERRIEATKNAMGGS